MLSTAQCVVGAWLIGWVLVIGAFDWGVASWRSLLDRLQNERGVSPGRARWGLACLILMIGLLLPLVLIGMLAVVAWERVCLRRLQKRLLTQHQELIFEWRRADDLPKKLRRYLNERAEAIQSLGFAAIGNYRMKPEPADYLARIFLSNDGETFSTCGQMGCLCCGELKPSFTTLFADGRVLETVLIETFDEADYFDQQDHYHTQRLPEATVAEAYEKHQARTREIAERFGTTPLRLPRDQVLDALVYEGRSFSQLLHEAGRFPDPPPEPVLPAGVAVEALAS